MTDHPSGSSRPEETQMDRTAAVTGGSKLGRAVVAALIEDRSELRSHTLAGQPAHFIRTDLTDYGQGQR